MIDFTFTPEIEAVRLKVRAFMDEQVRPQWDAIDQDDRAQVVKAIVELRKLAREDWNLWLPHMPAEWAAWVLAQQRWLRCRPKQPRSASDRMC